jgi:hypothetical protein
MRIGSPARRSAPNKAMAGLKNTPLPLATERPVTFAVVAGTCAPPPGGSLHCSSKESQMSDTPFSGDATRSTKPMPADPLQKAADTGREAAAQIGNQASDTAGQLRQEAAGALEEIKAEGADVAEAAKERALGFAEEQKRVGAEHAQGLARAVHSAAGELEKTSPQVARYVHEAGSAMDSLSRTLRDSSPGELMGRMEDLARRQPVAFFGAAVLAGFALRFLPAHDQPGPARHLWRDGRFAAGDGRRPHRAALLLNGRAGLDPACPGPRRG